MEPIAVYLNDHLAGSKVALDLLQDLGDQTADKQLATFAVRLRAEIESDQLVLKDLITRIGAEQNQLKEVAAWVAQKVGRVKISLAEPMGRFEAIEMLSLGVLGKLALWTALKALQSVELRLAGMDFDSLASRAIAQHSELEAMRLPLAVSALTGDHPQPTA